MSSQWPPPNAPDLRKALEQARDNKIVSLPQASPVERLTDAPRHILVPPGVSHTQTPRLPGIPPPPLVPHEKQREEKFERMRQNMKARDDFNRANQHDKTL